jgi:hypothetical protein
MSIKSQSPAQREKMSHPAGVPTNGDVPDAVAQRYGMPPVNVSNGARKIAADRAGIAALAVRADVPRRAISRILAGQPVNAGTYVRVCGTLCAFIGTRPHHYAHGFTGTSLCNSLAEKPIAVVAAGGAVT